MTREGQRLNKAIKILREKYDKAKDLQYVNDKVAWALYHTWNDFDAEGKRGIKE